MIPQLAPRSKTPAGGHKAARSEDLLERLRGVVGPAGTQIADGLVEALRQELQREYERGYHDGWASFRAPANDSGFRRFSRRLRRRARHGFRHWFAGTIQIRRVLLQLIMVAAICTAAVALSLHLTGASHDKKYAPPTITW